MVAVYSRKEVRFELHQKRGTPILSISKDPDGQHFFKR